MRKESYQLFMFHAENQGESQENALACIWKMHCSSAGFASEAACWKQSSQGAVQWAGAGLPDHLKSLAQLRAVALQTWVIPQAKVAHCELIPSITRNLWVRSSPCWLHYSPFSLLSSLMTFEPGGICRWGRSSAFPLWGAARPIRCETASRAGRGIVPAKEVPLESASVTPVHEG